MSKLRSLVVGTGGWAETHLKAYAGCRNIEPVGICGHRDAEKLAELSAAFGIPEQSLELGELIERVQPDVLDIACNPHFRLEGVRTAMVPSVRLLNVEKPLALTPEDAYEIERLCVENGKLLVINHQCKFLPGFAKAKQTIAGGAIGEIAFIRATCQGNLLEQGTHLIDMVMFFNDYCPVAWVMGQVDEMEGLDKPSGAAPDAAVAMMAFEDGVRATLDFGSVGHEIRGETGVKWYKFALDVYGSEGHVKVSLNNSLEVTTYSDGKTLIEESSWDKHYIEALTAHLDAAAAYARNPVAGHMSSLAKSMGSFHVTMAIYASATGGGRITLPQRFDEGLISRLRERGPTPE